MESVIYNLLEKQWNEFQENLNSQVAESFLTVLLNLMQLMLVVNRNYRNDIKKFNGKYQFMSKDGEIAIAVVFHNGRMEIIDKVIDDFNIKIIFRDDKTLLNFLVSQEQDILESILCHDLETEGNLNYLFRFGFLVKRLQLMGSFK